MDWLQIFFGVNVAWVQFNSFFIQSSKLPLFPSIGPLQDQVVSAPVFLIVVSGQHWVQCCLGPSKWGWPARPHGAPCVSPHAEPKAGRRTSWSKCAPMWWLRCKDFCNAIKWQQKCNAKKGNCLQKVSIDMLFGWWFKWWLNPMTCNATEAIRSSNNAASFHLL